MTVQNLYKEQFEELREMIYWTYYREDLENIGANTEDWTKEECEIWNQNKEITDNMVVKAFGGYDFTCDDFFSTAGKYEEYPDKEN